MEKELEKGNILAFDISTTCIGYSIFNEDGNHVVLKETFSEKVLSCNENMISINGLRLEKTAAWYQTVLRDPRRARAIT